MVNISSLDLCGSIVGLMYKGNRRYKSTIGGVLSFFFLLGIVALIIVYLKDFFMRSSPYLTYEDVKYYDPPNLNISSNFYFVVMTQYDGINIIRNDIMKIEAMFKIKRQTEWEIHEVTPIPCLVNSSLPSLFDRLELSKGLCFNMSDISLEGANVNELFKSFQIRFSLCTNTTDNNSLCYPKETMSDFFINTKPLALIYFLDTAFQIYNTSKRVSKYYNYLDVNLGFQNKKETNVFISLNSMLVDESYFFPMAPVNYSEFMIESTRDKVSVRADKETELLLINFMSSNYMSITHISYMQIIELLERICAIVNVLIIIISSIGNYFNHYQFQSDLMNSFYDLETFDNDNKHHHQYQRSTVNRKALTNKINDSLNSIKDQRLSPWNSPKENNFINRKDNSTIQMPHMKKTPYNLGKTDQNFSLIHQTKLTFNHHTNDTNSVHKERQKNKHHSRLRKFDHREIIQMSFITFFTCCLNKEANEHNREFCLINNSMIFYQDLKNVYRKLREIDLLKYLLLTNEQLNLYQVIPKPIFKKSHETKNLKEFAALIHNPNFHFMKSANYIENLLASSEMKDLFKSQCLLQDNDNKIYEKMLQLIGKGTQ